MLATIPAPGGGGDSGLAWAEGALWVGQYRDRKIHQIDPETGQILRTIESNRFVTGVTWVDGELWHATWEGDESELRRLDPRTGEVLERLEMPAGSGRVGARVRWWRSALLRRRTQREGESCPPAQASFRGQAAKVSTSVQRREAKQSRVPALLASMKATMNPDRSESTGSSQPLFAYMAIRLSRPADTKVARTQVKEPRHQATSPRSTLMDCPVRFAEKVRGQKQVKARDVGWLHDSGHDLRSRDRREHLFLRCTLPLRHARRREQRSLRLDPTRTNGVDANTRGASSFARTFVNPTTACFDAT